MNMKIHFVLRFTLYLFVICRGQGNESNYNRPKFIKVTNATIKKDYMQKIEVNNSEECAGLCYQKDECHSFVFDHSNETCELYKASTETHRLRISNADFYQFKYMSKNGCPVSVIYGAKFDEHNAAAGQVKPLLDCLQSCYQEPQCNAVTYNLDSSLCIMTNYTSLNATVIIVHNHWLHIEFIKSYKFQIQYNLDRIKSPANCTLRNLRLAYFKNEANGSGVTRTNRYTRKMNSKTFFKTLRGSKYKFQSRISCAASCDLLKRCIGFIYVNEKCILKTEY
ncbi:uncharacterized protein LOC106868215 [Octopus bimaculoides]|uniref:Apple domain-containing protein n=1 Tax=Octopus bimaculoides TaxID=37653 RepID=A0A0L8HWF0_OCTBM|nr:uncharacterized protein LOC106868215 [Octopus bimaculoides]|eukprot:XP_014768867.1 PREDICTED: uncharacterized protein LOC106868215 [Octopus bimaculoides]